MVLLNDAFRALAHNLRALVLGLLLAVFIGAAFDYSTAYAMHAIDPDHPPAWFVAFGLIRDVLFAAATAATYAVVFALLGRELDRPLWKCNVPGEALARFFTPWFMLMLLVRAAMEIVRLSESPEVYVFTDLLVNLTLVPVGACIMHRGALVWEELPETLSVITRQFRMFVPVLMVGLGQSILGNAFLISMSDGKNPVAERPGAFVLFSLASTFIDVLMFCMAWRICTLDRDTAPARHSDSLED